MMRACKYPTYTLQFIAGTLTLAWKLSLIHSDQGLVGLDLLHNGSTTFSLSICNKHLTKVLLDYELD